jgi:hypothetical protein
MIGLDSCGAIVLRESRIKEVPLQHGVTMTPYRGPVAQRRFDGHFPAAPQKTRHQNVAVRDRAPKSRFGRQFPHAETSPYVRNAATWRHFAGGPLQYAVETDWLAGAAGFEPLHMESEFATTLSPGAGLEHAHLELKARPIDASIPLRRDKVQQI